MGRAVRQVRRAASASADRYTNTIFPSFALVNPYGLLGPVNIVQAEAGDFTDAQATAQHQQRQGMIHGMRDLGEEGADVVLRERLGQRATPAQEMTGFDRVAREAVVLHHEVLKKMFEGIEPPVNRGWRPGAPGAAAG